MNVMRGRTEAKQYVKEKRYFGWINDQINTDKNFGLLKEMDLPLSGNIKKQTALIGAEETETRNLVRALKSLDYRMKWM
jgi:hypothetical protein